MHALPTKILALTTGVIWGSVIFALYYYQPQLQKTVEVLVQSEKEPTYTSFTRKKKVTALKPDREVWSDYSEITLLSTQQLTASDQVIPLAQLNDYTAISLAKHSGLAAGLNQRSTNGTFQASDQSWEILVNITRQPLAYPVAPTHSWPDSEISIDGDDLLAIANKSWRLLEDYEPRDLVSLSDYGIPSNSGVALRRSAAEQLQKMMSDMRAQGVYATATSGYRGYNQQVRVFAYWHYYYGLASAERGSAKPGHSEHQLGTTVDFVSPENNNILTTQFANTAAGRWLAAHSWEYGFVMSYPAGTEQVTGYQYEPWHFRFIGVENARQFRDAGVGTLTEWLADM